MGAEGGEGVGGALAELRVVAPEAEGGGGAENEGGERESDKEELESELWAGGEPVDEVAGGRGGLVGSGLNVAEEEGEHEESGREDEEEFEGGDGAFEEHGEDFVVQSTVWCQVEVWGRGLQSAGDGRRAGARKG